MLELKPEGLDHADVASQPLAVCGQQLIADSSGALYWPGQGALLVADMPLASAPGAPAGDVRRMLTRLAEVMDRYQPSRVVVLGIGGAGAALRPGADELQILHILQEEREWIWIAGEGDAAPPQQLGGRVCGELAMAGLTLRHRPTPCHATHEIAAQLYPVACVSLHGYVIRRPCFVGNRMRLVMPAFGAPGPGTNVLDPVFQRLLGNAGMAVWMLGQEGLYPVATRLLAAD